MAVPSVVNHSLKSMLFVDTSKHANISISSVPDVIVSIPYWMLSPSTWGCVWCLLVSRVKHNLWIWTIIRIIRGLIANEKQLPPTTTMPHTTEEDNFNFEYVCKPLLSMKSGFATHLLISKHNLKNVFSINVAINTLCEDGSVILCYLSEDTYTENLVLNRYDIHFSHVCNIKAYLQKYQCGSYGPHFTYLSHWKHRQGNFTKSTEYEFSGRFHNMPSSIFNHLEEFNITCPTEDRLYPWFMVYDFETILSHLPENQPTPWMKWSPWPHLCQCGFQCTRVYFSARFCPSGTHSTHSRHDEILGLHCWLGLRNSAAKMGPCDHEAGTLIQYSEQQLEKLKDKEDDTTDELKKKMGMQLEKIVGLLGQFQHQVPVLGFNGTCYDLNLVKSYLIPWLWKDAAPDADVTTRHISD